MGDLLRKKHELAVTNRYAHHLIGQDAVDAVVIQMDEPVQALQLVLPHLPEFDARWLHRQPVRVLRGQHTRALSAWRQAALKPVKQRRRALYLTPWALDRTS